MHIPIEKPSQFYRELKVHTTTSSRWLSWKQLCGIDGSKMALLLVPTSLNISRHFKTKGITTWPLNDHGTPFVGCNHREFHGL